MRSGLGLGERDEFLQRLRRHLGIDRDHLRRLADRRHRQELLERVERHLLLHERIDHELPGEHDAERVAVRRRLGDRQRRDRAGGGGAVLDHDRLAGLAGDVVAEQPRAEIGDAAGGEADDQADRLVGIILDAILRLRGAGAGATAISAASIERISIRTSSRDLQATVSR